MDLQIDSNRSKKLFIRELQTEGTTGEALLWYHALKSRKIRGFQFHRRYLINDSTVDFICKKLNLIIEIKRGPQTTRSVTDQKWEHDFEKMGYKVLYFSESEVINQLEEVVGKISHHMELLEKNLKPLQ